MTKITEYVVVLKTKNGETVRHKTKTANKEQAIARAKSNYLGCKIGYLLA